VFHLSQIDAGNESDWVGSNEFYLEVNVIDKKFDSEGRRITAKLGEIDLGSLDTGEFRVLNRDIKMLLGFMDNTLRHFGVSEPKEIQFILRERDGVDDEYLNFARYPFATLREKGRINFDVGGLWSSGNIFNTSGPGSRVTGYITTTATQ